MLDNYSNEDRQNSSVKIIDYNLLAAEMIRLLRGEMNQRDLSKKLGFTFNQVGKWESLVTQIKWDDFLELTATLDIPIEKYFRDYFFWSQDEVFNSTATIRALFQYTNIGCTDWQRSKNLMDKWLTGATVPDLAEVLMIINSKPLLLIGWISRFVDCSKIKSLEHEYKSIMSNLEAVLSAPVSAIVNAALHLQSYKNIEQHDEELLAKESGCSLKEVREALFLLCQSGAVIFVNRKYLSNFSELSFIRHPRMRAVTKYLTELAASRFSILPPEANLANPSLSSTRITAMSSEASKKIMTLMVKYHNDVSLVVKNDQGVKDHVRLMIQHSFVSNLNNSED